MSYRAIVSFSAALILAVCLYGYLTDEPYWREIGHSPDLYDFLLWAALVMNGPAGFIANRIAEFVPSNIYNDNQHFLVEFGFWLLLLWPQWKSYDLLAQWCMGDRQRATTLYIAIASIAAIACVVAYKTYFAPEEILHPLYIDRIFPIARVVALAFSGLVIISYIEMRQRIYLREAPSVSPA